METEWGVWVQEPGLGWGMRRAKAETAEQAMDVVKRELATGMNGPFGVLFSKVLGAEPVDLAMTRTEEEEVRKATASSRLSYL